MRNSQTQRDAARKLLTKHGMYYTRMYKIWGGIVQRCTDVKATMYPSYGAVGITIDSEWRNDFMSFYNWAISNGYSDELTIDRIDSSGNYEPSNCRWVDATIQASNRRTPKHNTSGYSGVWLENGRWRAVIRYKKKSISLGYYDSPTEAAIARNKYVTENNLPHKIHEIKE